MGRISAAMTRTMRGVGGAAVEAAAAAGVTAEAETGAMRARATIVAAEEQAALPMTPSGITLLISLLNLLPSFHSHFSFPFLMFLLFLLNPHLAPPSPPP